MTIAEGVPSSRPAASELIHENAVLGCLSWSKWDKLNFEQKENLTWYRSPVKDILFNSVLDANLNEDVFPSVLQEVTDYCLKEDSPIAWLVPKPARLTEFHRNAFVQAGFRECPGTTGMILEMDKPELQALFLPKQQDQRGDELEVLPVDSDELLIEWAKILIESYRFPQILTDAWIELHSSIGYRKSAEEKKQPGWEHFVLRLNDTLVATSSLFCGDGPEHSSFANLAVHPSKRGTGIGSYLVRQSLARLLEYGYQTTTLYSSQDAFDLYSRLGFTPCLRNTFFVRDRESAR